MDSTDSCGRGIELSESIKTGAFLDQLNNFNHSIGYFMEFVNFLK
jgi:hypothetical protein